MSELLFPFLWFIMLFQKHVATENPSSDQEHFDINLLFLHRDTVRTQTSGSLLSLQASGSSSASGALLQHFVSSPPDNTLCSKMLATYLNVVEKDFLLKTAEFSSWVHKMCHRFSIWIRQLCKSLSWFAYEFMSSLAISSSFLVTSLKKLPQGIHEIVTFTKDFTQSFVI